MRGAAEQMEGFEAGTRDLPTPPVTLEDSVRERMRLALAAIIHHATPEELALYVSEGFPPAVEEALDRPGESEEVDAHIDTLLSLIPSDAFA